ncbi:glycosyltransferase family 4 protein [Butyrivibrio sp. INlla16]|uniref:glycosyltransferase family 4 protein n=1 Tax=Butyrivibrio sp. INlla16 TaxID=1520807 RepID=UPI00088FCC04|nr:glycosyltransferase family 4 protein [Butyrivibrio sp. INlla16]SDB63024.1 Glycosyltransferase involved in cell wall bisynthesis [Butyrivibrio sp. INlla16]
MKILIVSHEYPPIGGGGANACMNLSREFASMGHKVHIVTAWFEGQKEYEEQQAVSNPDGLVAITRIKSKRKYMDHCSFSEMFDYLKKALPITGNLHKKNNYDLCLVFFGIPSGPIGYYLKKKYKLPYVIRFGGGDIPGFQDRFAFVYKLIAPAVKIIWRNADALVANSKGLQKFAEGFYNKKEIEIIPNGVDINAFSVQNDSKNTQNERKEDTINLLFVSRLIERKGLQDILPQLTQVNNHCNREGKRIKLRIVGDGPYRSTLEELVHKEQLEDIVTFEGLKSKTELPEYYVTSDIFVFPSRKEGMPNVVLEAMSYGLPIIMTPCQGSEELVDGNGYISRVDKFGDKILELIQNEQLRQQMGLKSVERVKNYFSWRIVADKYQKMFERF